MKNEEFPNSRSDEREAIKLLAQITRTHDHNRIAITRKTEETFIV